jgi:hypothetical protein
VTTLLNVLWVAAFGVFFFFCASYHILAPWWRSDMGRNTMMLKVSITALLGLRVLAVTFGEGFWGQDLLRVLLMIALIGAGFHRWVMLLKAQRRNLDGDVAASE